MTYTLLFQASGTITVDADNPDDAMKARRSVLLEDIDWNEPQFVACFENKE